jgi:hypothetical protein
LADGRVLKACGEHGVHGVVHCCCCRRRVFAHFRRQLRVVRGGERLGRAVRLPGRCPCSGEPFGPRFGGSRLRAGQRLLHLAHGVGAHVVAGRAPALKFGEFGRALADRARRVVALAFECSHTLV